MDLKEGAKVFYHIALGIGALAGASWLLWEFWIWIKIRWYRWIRYRPATFGKKWDLIKIPDKSPVYVRHLKKNFRRHVANPETMVDLGFDWNSIKDVTREAYDGIRGGTPIITHRK